MKKILDLVHKNLNFQVGMEFWINVHGCQPYPRNSHLCTKISLMVILSYHQAHPPSPFADVNILR